MCKACSNHIIRIETKFRIQWVFIKTRKALPMQPAYMSVDMCIYVDGMSEQALHIVRWQTGGTICTNFGMCMRRLWYVYTRKIWYQVRFMCTDSVMFVLRRGWCHFLHFGDFSRVSYVLWSGRRRSGRLKATKMPESQPQGMKHKTYKLYVNATIRVLLKVSIVSTVSTVAFYRQNICDWRGFLFITYYTITLFYCLTITQLDNTHLGQLRNIAGRPHPHIAGSYKGDRIVHRVAL